MGSTTSNESAVISPPYYEMQLTWLINVCRLDWAKLHTIELSLLDSPDPAVVTGLVKVTKTAILEDGFLYLTDYGVSLDQLQRQFDLAQYLHRNISEEDKERLLWDPSSGIFAGFKRRFGWKREKGEVDSIEQFNFYQGEFQDPKSKVPEVILPFMDEITAFCEVHLNCFLHEGKTDM